MIEIKEVTTKKDRKAFMRFPIELYKGNPYYVPVLNIDEQAIFKKDYIYNSTCDVIFFLAYDEGKVVGRISGIIQRASNEKWGQKRARFTRFDSVDDYAVANALFDAVTKWARKMGMTEAVGPLGYSDLEREGLLIETGFDQLSTYEEQYNYPYYQKLIENYGFQKDVDWVEYKLYSTKGDFDKMKRISDKVMEKYGLTLVQAKSVKQFIRDYADEFFALIDTSYDKIYGTVPFTREMKDMMISNFKLLARMKDVGLIVNKEGHIVAFSIMFPSISEAVNRSRGKITPRFILDFLKAKRHPKIIDLGLIGVLPEYESKGVASALLVGLHSYLKREKPEHLETNLMLEQNAHILNFMKNFEKETHKKRRCYKLDIV